MTKLEEYRKNAANCSAMADEAETAANRARYRLMEEAWNELAETQTWLDGKIEDESEFSDHFVTGRDAGPAET